MYISKGTGQKILLACINSPPEKSAKKVKRLDKTSEFSKKLKIGQNFKSGLKICKNRVPNVSNFLRKNFCSHYGDGL